MNFLVQKLPARAIRWAAAIALSLGLCVSANGQKVSFREAIERAVTHSAGMRIVMADATKARMGYAESRNMFIPQVTFGSGIAKTWGYPMSIEGSAPSLFNITSQSFLFNLAQKNFMQAAKTDWNAATLSLADQRQATILETALTYIQLDREATKLAALRKQAEDAARLEAISRERLQEGVDSKLDLTRASLAAAQVRLRIASSQSNTDLLRQRLAQLTGLDARELATDPATIPATPQIDQEQNLGERAAQNSAAVKAAEEKAKAQKQRAEGEHKQLYPAVDLVANYGLFTKYNNLDLLFPTGQFQQNNATFGISIRFGFFNAPQRARAAAADAEAIHASEEARALREQVANNTLKLQRSVQQLTAARDVAQLEYEVAQGNIDVVEANITAGGATLKDRENARIVADDKYTALLDSQFELDRACLQLLRVTGDLDKWALP